METELTGIRISLCIEDRHRTDTAGRTVDLRIIRIQNTGHITLGRRFRFGIQVIGVHDTQCGYDILSDITGLRIHLPAHNRITGICHNQITRTVHREGTVSRKEVLGSVAYYKEGGTFDHDIPGIVRGLRRTLLRNRRRDCSCFGTQTDLSGVNAAASGIAVGSGCRLRCLVQQIAEYHIL